MSNNVLKTIIKHLAKSNIYAAREALNELKSEQEKAEAMRIFEALKIKTEDNRK